MLMVTSIFSLAFTWPPVLSKLVAACIALATLVIGFNFDRSITGKNVCRVSPGANATAPDGSMLPTGCQSEFLNRNILPLMLVSGIDSGEGLKMDSVMGMVTLPFRKPGLPMPANFTVILSAHSLTWSLPALSK